MPDLERFRAWLRDTLSTRRGFDNLGGRGQGFEGKINDIDSSLEIQVISTGSIYNVPWTHIEQCYKRCEFLVGKEKMQTSSYTRPKWQDCPDMVTMPYVAKIIIEYDLERNNQ
jgi:hypothetical protein